MEWQRARTDEKKNERRDAIYSAAFKLFREKGYDKVSFNGIAAEAGFTKSNLYRYFSSKDDIFLSIFSELFEGWVDDCLQRLAELPEHSEIERFTASWVASTRGRTQYLDLATLMLTSLERNSSFEQLLVFKRLAMNRLYEIAVAVCRIYPGLSIPQGFTFLTLGFAATNNYWAGATTNDALDRIYQMDEFQQLKPDFEGNLASAISVILRGLLAAPEVKTE